MSDVGQRVVQLADVDAGSRPAERGRIEGQGGVSEPELEVVQVLERERPMGPDFGREKESSWAAGGGVRKRDLGSRK